MRRLVGGARVGALATIGQDGRPHVVPITFVLAIDGLYSAIDHKPKSTSRLVRLANIERDARVSVLVQHYADDWTELWWVRADGSGRVLAAGEEQDEAMAALAAKYAQYREDPPEGPVIAVDVTRWAGWTYAEGGAKT